MTVPGLSVLIRFSAESQQVAITQPLHRASWRTFSRSVTTWHQRPVGELLGELGKYDRSIRVEISSDDDDLDEDMIYSRYPNGRDGEGTEYVDLQAACLRATRVRPVGPRPPEVAHR